MSAFRFKLQLTSRFRDCDMFGHVNNAVYFTYMEEARWAYWRHITGDFPHSRLPGLILARVECDFIKPLQAGERLDIWLGTTRLGKSSMTMECELMDERAAEVARGKSVVVCYDYAAVKPTPIPDWCRTRIEEYEGRQLSRA
jgi:acyl-CoA thioester hydrolase